MHSLVYGLWGCFYFWAIINNAAVNICVHIFVWIYIFFSLGHIPRSEILLLLFMMKTLFLNKLIYLYFIFGCVGSSLLSTGFLYLQ